MTPPIFVLNWKMYLGAEESLRLAKQVVEVSTAFPGSIIVCPSFPELMGVAEVLKNSSLQLGAQTIAEVDAGADTGEVSGSMLSEIGVTHVIVGHSERRRLQNETDDIVQKKIAATYRAKLTPILCVGETAEEKAASQGSARVESQVKKALTGVESGKILIAYEPIWAISANPGSTPATPEDASTMADAISRAVKAVAPNVEAVVLYGGSVDSSDARSYVKDGVAGVLVGKASTNALEVEGIIRALS